MKRRTFLTGAGLLGAAGIGGAVLAQGGKNVNPYYSGPDSDHFDGTRFFNPGGEAPRGFTDLLRWQFGGGKMDWPDTVETTQSKPDPRVDDLRVTMVGHATMLIQVAGLNLLTDPVWSLRASPFSFAGPKRVTVPGIAFDALPPIDAMVHCAGVTDEEVRADPGRAVRRAGAGTAALLSAARAAGATRFVQVSSAHVYGPLVGTIDESTPCAPQGDYARAHAATEAAFTAIAEAGRGSGVACVSLRPCAVFGDLPDPAGFRRWSLVPFAFPRAAIRDGEIVIRSTGAQRRNFVGSEDVAAACADWLARPSPGWSALNPVGATTCSIHDFARLCADLAEELTGRVCTITRAAPVGATAGEDLDYRSLRLGPGTQSLRTATSALMRRLQEAPCPV